MRELQARCQPQRIVIHPKASSWASNSTDFPPAWGICWKPVSIACGLFERPTREKCLGLGLEVAIQDLVYHLWSKIEHLQKTDLH